MKLDVNRTGLSAGILFSIVSLICALVVLILGAGNVISFFELFTHTKITGFQPIDVTAGKIIVGLIASFIAGYVLGAVYSLIYNKLGK